MKRRFQLCFWVLGLSLPAGLALAVEGKVRFNRDVRPILSDKCFFCHGPDAKKQKADLRLDVREAAVKDGHIRPGDAQRSSIIERILSDDPSEVMPPPESKLGTLTTAEVAILKQWIQEGAEYEAHWAFIPLPAQAAAPNRSIDSIVEAGLAARGLSLQPEAERSALRRRLSFDLTGLPPKEDAGEDLAAFIRNLLASPQYGEKMAVEWLDVARYADSYGFQVDRERDVWPWRDWVVKSFNENMPFDEFITYQLAGDLLPNPTQEQRLATAFNRLHQQESEGGSVEEEYRVEYVADRVQTVATAFLGLTFECARCHDHKYDPVSQKDYYALFSMFQNIDEAGLYSFFTPSPPTPTMMLMQPSAEARLRELQAAVSHLEKAHQPPLKTPELSRGELAYFPMDEEKGAQVLNQLNPDPKSAATLKGENTRVPGKKGRAVKFTGDDAMETQLGNFKREEPFSISLWLQTPDAKERAVVLHRSRAWTDAASRGYELLIEQGRLKWSLIHFWPGNAISIQAKEKLKIGEWTHVVVTSDGSSRASGLRLYVNGVLAEVEVVKDALTKTIQGGGGDAIHLGERFRDKGFKDGLVDELRIFHRDVSQKEDAPPELAKARAALYAFQDEQKEIMVMQELPERKKAYLLNRGEYDKRLDEVGPAVPAVLSAAFPSGAPLNRLGLAQFLTSREQPLTARVVVNRLWQSLFGRGLVKTVEDFGSQGERPLYPELLDYLALRFMQSGWDMKALVEEIVSSRVYRQRSVAAQKVMEDDPENQWLARGPRVRLAAEMIRDNALAASGLLDLKMGGPPVFPYEMTEAFKPIGPSQGTDVFRRSLYTQWRRTSPPPAMVAFDAPRRAVCQAKREQTDSPLQALILLNGIQYVEAARVLGEKLHHETRGDLPRMIELGFQRCLSRQPDAKEREICTRLYHEQRQHFQTHPEEASTLLKMGSVPRDPNLPIPEAAAATILAQTLLNHDECVVKR